MLAVQPVALLGYGIAAAVPAAGYTVSRIPITESGPAVAVNPSTDTVYFASYGSPELIVVDGVTNAESTSIPLAEYPAGVAVDPATNTIYVSMNLHGTGSGSRSAEVAVIDGRTNKVTDTISLVSGASAVGVAVNSTTDTVYVAEDVAGAVAVIDGSTNSVTTTVSTGSGTAPAQLAVDETTNTVWVADLGGAVLAINGVSNTVTRTISLPAANVEAIAVSPASDTVYADTTTDGVAVIAGGTGVVATYIKGTRIGAQAGGIAIDAGSGTVFVTSADSSLWGTTWVIDASSNTITDTIPRGGLQIAVDAASGSVYEPAYNPSNDAWLLTPSGANAWSPVITSTSATLTAGIAGSFTIAGSALPTATYSETGALPTGVTLSPSGTLSGTPAAGTGGVYPITITASNGISPDFSQAFTLTVLQPPTISAPSSMTFQVGTPVNVPLQVSGYPAPNVTGANLPSGLAVVSPGPGQWVLTGIPAAGSGHQTYETSLQATNSAGTSSVAVLITVQDAPGITSAASTTFLTDTVNSYAVQARCDVACTFAVTGSLPSGVSLSSNGVLAGSPPLGTVGLYRFTISASNSIGTATQAFTLTVEQPTAIGVEGTDGQLWAQAPQFGLGWHPLGGQITAPPAVAAIPGSSATTLAAPLFIAAGSDNTLWMRSVTAGWQKVGPETASCLGSPAAVVTGTLPGGPFTLTIACRGLDNALWENSATIPASGLPTVTARWTSLGGVLSAGPAVALIGGTMRFFVRGTNGRIFTRTLNSGYSAMPWYCIGAPAAASLAPSVNSLFACQGTDHALWEAGTSGSGGQSDWNDAVSLGGSLIGGPAIADTSGPYLLAEGTNHAVFERTELSAWISLGGSVIGGVGAAALLN